MFIIICHTALESPVYMHVGAPSPRPQRVKEHGMWLIDFFYRWLLALGQNSVHVFGMNRAASPQEMSFLDTLSSLRACLISFIDPEMLVGFFPLPFLLGLIS